MTKYTKRQYLADLAKNTAEMEAVDLDLASIEARFQSGENVGESWNVAHDRKYDIAMRRQDIETAFRKRNWNYQDHALNDLVSQNID